MQTEVAKFRLIWIGVERILRKVVKMLNGVPGNKIHGELPGRNRKFEFFFFKCHVFQECWKLST